MEPPIKDTWCSASIACMLFADDFVGVCDSVVHLQKPIDVVYAYCFKWWLKANISRSAVIGMLHAVEGS